MIFGKKRQRLNNSLGKLYPKYIDELEKRKEHHEMILDKILRIFLILSSAIMVVGFALAMFSSEAGK